MDCAERELKNFLQIKCIFDDDLSVGRGVLEQAFRDHVEKEKPSLQLTKKDFSNLMNQLCREFGLEYVKRREGYRYCGIGMKKEKAKEETTTSQQTGETNSNSSCSNNTSNNDASNNKQNNVSAVKSEEGFPLWLNKSLPKKKKTILEALSPSSIRTFPQQTRTKKRIQVVQ